MTGKEQSEGNRKELGGVGRGRVSEQRPGPGWPGERMEDTGLASGGAGEQRGPGRLPACRATKLLVLLLEAG